MSTAFASTLNNFSATLAANYAAGSGSVALAAGTGAKINAALAALGLPAIGASAPLRFTLVSANALNGYGQIATPSLTAVYLATGLTGDTLTGVVVAEGTTDQAFFIGDTFATFFTAGQIAAIQAAVTQLETGGLPANASALQSYPITGGMPPASIQALVWNGTGYVPETVAVITPDGVSVGAVLVNLNPNTSSIGAGATACNVAGGSTTFPNVIGTSCQLSSIWGGYGNTISPGSISANILGNHHQIITPSGSAGHGAALGGSFNTVIGDYSAALGTLNLSLDWYGWTGGRQNVVGAILAEGTLHAATLANATTFTTTNLLSRVSTTLSASATAGATTISAVAIPSTFGTQISGTAATAGTNTLSLAAVPAAGQQLWIDDGANSEAVTVQTPTSTGAAPFVATLTGNLAHNHATGITVYGVGQTLWIADAAGTGESVTVSQITGTGPYTATLNAGLAGNHASGVSVYALPQVVFIGNGATGEYATVTQLFNNAGTYTATVQSALLLAHAFGSVIESIGPPGSVTDCFNGGGQHNRLYAHHASSLGGFANVANPNAVFAALLGGQSNVASGWNSAVGGFQCSASGSGAFGWGSLCTSNGTSTIAFGTSLTVSGAYGAGVGGNGNTIGSTATYGFAGGGTNNSITAVGGAAIGGSANTVSGANGVVSGTQCLSSGANSDARGVFAVSYLAGMRSFSAGRFSNPGDSQGSDLVAQGTTLNTTPLTLLIGATGELAPPPKTLWGFLVIVCGVDHTTNAPAAGFYAFGWLWKGATSGSATLFGTSTPVACSGNLAGTACSIGADSSGNGLAITVTGTTDTIRWTARVVNCEQGA